MTPSDPAPVTTSLINEPPAEPVGAPATYTPFTFPEGFGPAESTLADATSIFRELGLNQAQAQRLVDYHAKQIADATRAASQTVETMRSEWRNQLQADPVVGPKLEQIKTNIGRAFASVNDPELTAEFQKAMDLTGAGDHPAFVKMFNKFAERLSEGSHISGGNPSPHGQNIPGANTKPTPAAAMYPNLPH